VIPGFTTTARDGGNQTIWDVSETHQYTSDVGSRSINVIRIRQPPPKQPPQKRPASKPQKPADDPRLRFKAGRIIEVLLVPPGPDSIASAITRFTPSPGLPVEQATRLRRFVIYQQNTNSFGALAIKTYQGRGVAAPGVIKSHHAIIYSTRVAPEAAPDELPPPGHPLGGMQNQAIRVKSWDRERMLDPKARLDYMDRYEFDYGLGNIRVWGKLHEKSEATFYAQYHTVWRTVINAATGPGPLIPGYQPPPSDTASTSGTVIPSNTQVVNPSMYPGQPSRAGAPRYAGNQVQFAPPYSSSSTRPAAPPASAAPLAYTSASNSRVASGHPPYGRQEPIQRPPNIVQRVAPDTYGSDVQRGYTPAMTQNTAQPTATSGIMSDPQVRVLIERLQTQAREGGLPVPGVNLTNEEVHTLAVNPIARGEFVRNIQASWAARIREQYDSRAGSDSGGSSSDGSQSSRSSSGRRR